MVGLTTTVAAHLAVALCRAGEDDVDEILLADASLETDLGGSSNELLGVGHLPTAT